MATRESGPEEPIQYYDTFSNFEVSEVDNILQGRKLRYTILDRGSLPMPMPMPMPKVSKIQQAHKIQKIATHSGKDKNMEDRISRLPDDILNFIISLLTMREGAATSILSRRWGKLWSTSVSCLYFDEGNLIGYMYPDEYFQVKEKEFVKNKWHNRTMRITQIPQLHKKELLESERANFIRRANQIWWSILQHPRVSPLDALRVSFPLGKESASDVDQWMKFAAAQGVTELDLDFNFLDFYCLKSDFDNAYEFPVQGFGSSLTYLCLRSCIFDFPPDFQGFNSLISLSLNNSFLPNNSLQNILSNCPLEWLCLRKCKFSDPTILKFVGPSILLKHLQIDDCDIKEILVHDVNLLSFELGEGKIKLSIRNVPHLVRFVLITGKPVEILSHVPRLKTLFLEHQNSKLPELSVFNNIKRLVYSAENHERNLFEVVCILEACPLLQQLQLDMGIFRYICRRHPDLPEESRRIRKRHGRPHNNLKKVVIYGFDCHRDLIALARYLLKNAIVLEKMEIHTTSASYRGGGRWTHSKTAELVEMPLKKVWKLLQKEANPFTQFILPNE